MDVQCRWGNANEAELPTWLLVFTVVWLLAVLLICFCRVAAEVEDSVQFADESPKPEKGQLLENVFADPRGFGIAPDGRYR